LRAHARQYAIMYMYEFPNQPYSRQNLDKLAIKDHKLYKYLHILPQSRKEFPHLASEIKQAILSFEDQIEREVNNYV